MSRYSDPPPRGNSALAVVSGIAGILFGIIVGYLIAIQQQPPASAATVMPVVQAAAAAPPPAPIVNEQELQAYRDILKSDPRNLRAAVELGNRLYDAGRWMEAIEPYKQAYALDPKNINVSTDLATAIWYSGDADQALAQFDKSLALDARHPQTLFNIGIVRSEGKNDYAGAIRAWETLLEGNPAYPEASRVRQLIEQAKAKGGAR
jgi:cytochrome c-type biogenesis protein CcmH/NrfG